MALKHVVAPLMEAVGKLFGGRVPQMCLGTRSISVTCTTISRASTARSTARATCSTTAIQVNLALIGIADNEVTKRLAA